jgi:hypothetical protein
MTWQDGRVHDYTMLLALRIDSLPPSCLRLFNGGLPPAQGEKTEHVQVYKNGGVGALGSMGTREASVRAGRWAWVAVTRNEGQRSHRALPPTPFSAQCRLTARHTVWPAGKKGELKTYVNGQLCAEVALKERKASKEGEGKDGAKPGGKGKEAKGEENEEMKRKEVADAAERASPPLVFPYVLTIPEPSSVLTIPGPSFRARTILVVLPRAHRPCFPVRAAGRRSCGRSSASSRSRSPSSPPTRSLRALKSRVP